MLKETIGALCPVCYDALTFFRTPLLPFVVWIVIVAVLAIMTIGTFALLYEILKLEIKETKKR